MFCPARSWSARWRSCSASPASTARCIGGRADPDPAGKLRDGGWRSASRRRLLPVPFRQRLRGGWRVVLDLARYPDYSHRPGAARLRRSDWPARGMATLTRLASFAGGKVDSHSCHRSATNSRRSTCRRQAPPLPISPPAAERARGPQQQRTCRRRERHGDDPRLRPNGYPGEPLFISTVPPKTMA